MLLVCCYYGAHILIVRGIKITKLQKAAYNAQLAAGLPISEMASLQQILAQLTWPGRTMPCS